MAGLVGALAGEGAAQGLHHAQPLCASGLTPPHQVPVHAVAGGLGQRVGFRLKLGAAVLIRAGRAAQHDPAQLVGRRVGFEIEMFRQIRAHALGHTLRKPRTAVEFFQSATAIS